MDACLHSTHLEVSGSLNGEDEEDGAALVESSGEFVLVAGRGGPDSPLLRQLDVPRVAALHDEVAHTGAQRPRGRRRAALDYKHMFSSQHLSDIERIDDSPINHTDFGGSNSIPLAPSTVQSFTNIYANHF